MSKEWLIWQLADSAFPSGGFAHSGGLEASWQHRVVTNGESLAEFLGNGLRQQSRGVLRFVVKAWRNSAPFDQIDTDCDLFLNNHVANRASRAQGQAFIASAARTFEVESLVTLARAVRERHLAGHFGPVFGRVTQAVGFDEPTTVSLFSFIWLRGTISAAVRLGIIGPIEGQQIQTRLSAVESVADGEAVQVSPVLDLIQGTQERLYSRLFQS